MRKSNADIKQVLALYESGMSKNKIAQVVGCNYQTVSRWIKESGKERSYYLTADIIKQIERLYLVEHRKAKDIAMITGFPYSKVNNIIARYDLVRSTHNYGYIDHDEEDKRIDAYQIKTVDDPVFYVQQKPTYKRMVFNGKSYKDATLEVIGM